MEYSVLKSRPREIYRYGVHHDKIRFNYNGLHPYRLREKLRIGDKYSPTLLPSLSYGSRKYRRKIFNLTESRIGFFLLTIVAYESMYKIKPSTKLEILCHNGLHYDLISRTNDVYNVILYKNKLIFSNTATRAEDNPFFAYIGIKLETVLCNQPSPTEAGHNKLLLQGTYGRWDFKSVVEIDSFRSYKGKTLEKMSPKERCNNYCEIKMCFTEAATTETLTKLKTRSDLLLFLKDNVNYFGKKFEKWLFQSYFGRQNILTVGIRNKDFKLICNEDFDMDRDLIPFAESTYPELYAKFTNSINTLDQKYEEIYNKVKSLQQKETDVFIMDCKTLNVELVAEKDMNGRTFENILIPEYLEWVNNGNDTLLDNPLIDKEYYAKSRESGIDKLTEDITKLSVSEVKEPK